MGLESANYISDLNTSNPAATDAKSQGDDHLRLIKSVLKNTFAGFSGMVIVTGTEAQGSTVNDYTVTVSPAPSAYKASMLVVFKATHTCSGSCTIQVNALGTKTLLNVEGAALKTGDIVSGDTVLAFYDGTQFYLLSGNDRANRNGDTYTGTHNFTGATVNAATVTATTPATADNSTNAATTAWVLNYLANAPTAATPTTGDNSTRIATTAFAVQLAFAAALPGQAGKANKWLKTDGANASWEDLELFRSARTSNTILGINDQARFIDITSGTFTQTFAACATLVNGWYCIIRNSGTGDITLDPNSTETIDGLATLIMYPGETRLIQCDGTALRSVVLSSFIKTFSASGTFTNPSGYRLFAGFLWGAGASGGKGQAGVAGGVGGGGGACVPFTIPASSFGATETITIGAGGAAISANNTAGNDGGNSTVGSLVTSYGGVSGGGAGVLSKGTTTTGGQPDTESSTGNNYYGGGDSAAAGTSSYYGGGGASDATNPAGAGGNSVFGGAGGAGVGTLGAAASGGTSTYGGQGGANGNASNGTAGTQPGGGGGATVSGANSGAGGDGQLIIWGIV
jgi:hypothetical protein